MCNEYVVDMVDGRWVWVRLAIGGGGQVVADFNPDNPEVVPSPQIISEHAKRWAGFPDREMPVAILGPGGGAKLEIMRWGFPPPKMPGPVVTNVRNYDKPFWKRWLEPEWRCLVPVTDFCEWTDAPPKRKKWFRLKEDTPFMFAGIWRTWTGTRGTKVNPIEGEHKVFAFLTTQPNNVIGAIHAKAQPVILKREHWRTWLTAPTEIALELVRSSPDSDMEIPADAAR